MKHPFCCLFLAICGVLFACGCGRHPEVPWDERKIDSLIEYSPDEALYLLEQCDGECASADEPVRMRHALLKTKSADLAYIPHTSVHPMQEVTDYYAGHGTPGERMEAYYYMGRVYRDLHDIPRALEWYLKAREAAVGITSVADFMTLRRIYSQLAALYTQQKKYEEALEAGKESYAIEEKNGSIDILSVHKLAEQYAECGKNDSAHIYYKLSNHMIKRGGSRFTMDDLAYVAGALNFYKDHRNTSYLKHEYDWCWDVLKKHGPTDLPANACAVKADIFEAEGLLDSAIAYNLQVRDSFSLYKDKSVTAKHLYRLYESRGQTDRALYFAGQALRYADSSVAALQEDNFSRIDNEFSYHRDWKQEYEDKEKYILINRYMIAALFLALVALSLLCMSYRRNRRMRRKLLDVSRMSEQYELQLHENDIRKGEQVRKFNMALLALRDRLSEMAVRGLPVDANIKQEIFATVDNAFPDFRKKLEPYFHTMNTDNIYLCYLVRLGLKQNDIAVFIGRSSSSVSRRVRQIEAEIGFVLVPPASPAATH